jgi:succinoglycan biosynthesis transport protein ExoP
MTVADVLRAVRGRWLLFVLCCLAPVAAAGALTRHSSTTYQSTAVLYVAATYHTSSGSGAYQGALLAQQQAPSIAQLVNSPVVLKAVIRNLNLTGSPAQLAAQLSAVSPTNSVLIDVTARSGSPAAARNIANVTGAQLADLAERLAAADRPGHAPVKVTIANPAVLPTAPLPQHKKTSLILGLVTGLAVAFTAVILREKLDPRIRTAQQAGEAADCRLVWVFKGNWRTAIPWSPVRVEAESAVAESFRRLRIRLLPATAAHGTYSLAATSLETGDPGAAVAVNLALALVESGSTVALLDTDPHSSLVADYLGLDGSAGIASVVNGITPLEEAIQKYGERLFVLPAGATGVSQSPIVSQTELTELMELLGRRVDHVVISVAPIFSHADTAELCATADTVVLATRTANCRKGRLRLAAEILRSAGADLGGVVLAPKRLAPMTSAFRAVMPIPSAMPARNRMVKMVKGEASPLKSVNNRVGSSAKSSVASARPTSNRTPSVANHAEQAPAEVTSTVPFPAVRSARGHDR